MEGIVLNYDKSTNKGILRNNSGEEFEFSDTDWKSNGGPRTGTKVDFVAKDNLASEIYTVGSPVISAGIADKLSEFKESGIKEKLRALFVNGIHNKIGFTITVAVLLSLFLPIIEIPIIEVQLCLIHGLTGKFLFVLLVVLAISFYGGVTRLYTRILASIVSGIVFFNYYQLFSELSQASDFVGGLFSSSDTTDLFSLLQLGVLFSLLQWGVFVNIVACVLLLLQTYRGEYFTNQETI